MKVVAGQSVIKTPQDDVLEMLEGIVQDIRDGKKSPNNVFCIVVEDDVDHFVMSHHYVGRVVKLLGYLEIAKHEIIEVDVGADTI